MADKGKNLPVKFATDPVELTPLAGAYKQLNVVETIEKITKSSVTIVNELAKINMETGVVTMPIVKTLLAAETLTLSSLYKLIVYHSHMIDQMMIRADETGDVDVSMFFQISELSSKSTALMTDFTLFLRSLPNHLQRLNSDFITLIEVEDNIDDGISYADGAAGDEELIETLDHLLSKVTIEQTEILNSDLDANLEFDPGDITESDEPDEETKKSDSMNPDNYD